MEERAKNLGAAEDRQQKESYKISGMTWTAYRQGEAFAGCISNFLGNFVYQLEGSRLVVVADAIECANAMMDLKGRKDSERDVTDENALSVYQELGL